ncbi:histidine phosphatase family protein [Nocardiopsis sp. CNT312]|uniref:histidine phosphatase family protein n=1 Tax=Nocardiopsis sp. CNT312 TaxID=1137268 RepID=UPI0004B92044|nr:histidine phosphatase family protein [Nocardiopsis sp. CNT312]
MRAALVRHGRTPLNAQNRFQGQSDAPLDEEGRIQAKRVARSLTPGRWTAVYSSPMLRAVQTARAAARRLDLTHTVFTELRERDLGTVDGLERGEFSRRHPDVLHRLRSDPGFAPPGGESGRAALARFSRGLGRVAASEHGGGPVLVVTHGGVLDLLARALQGARHSGMVGTCRAACVDIGTGGYGPPTVSLLQWDVDPRSCEDASADLPAPPAVTLAPKGNALL